MKNKSTKRGIKKIKHKRREAKRVQRRGREERRTEAGKRRSLWSRCPWKKSQMNSVCRSCVGGGGVLPSRWSLHSIPSSSFFQWSSRRYFTKGKKTFWFASEDLNVLRAMNALMYWRHFRDLFSGDNERLAWLKVRVWARRPSLLTFEYAVATGRAPCVEDKGAQRKFRNVFRLGKRLDSSFKNYIIKGREREK